MSLSDFVDGDDEFKTFVFELELKHKELTFDITEITTVDGEIISYKDSNGIHYKFDKNIHDKNEIMSKFYTFYLK